MNVTIEIKEAHVRMGEELLAQSYPENGFYRVNHQLIFVHGQGDNRYVYSFNWVDVKDIFEEGALVVESAITEKTLLNALAVVANQVNPKDL